MSRTIVYIDGLNLYYTALKGKLGHRWLDLEALCRTSLPSTCNIVRVNYYTAPVSARVDAGAPARQAVYFAALNTLPLVTIHKGSFLAKKKFAGLVEPVEFRPQIHRSLWTAFCWLCRFNPAVVRIWKTEEKGSDVNLGVQLVRDAFLGAFDEAAVLTNDTDLVEAIRIVTREVGRPVTLLTTQNKPATKLAQVSTDVRHVQPYIGPCQLPNPIRVPGKPDIVKPASW